MDRDQQDLAGVIQHRLAPRMHDRARTAEGTYHMTDQTPEQREASGSIVHQPTWVARHELPVFFALTFLLSWLFWPFTVLNPDSSPLVPFGPLLAAITVTALTGGRRHVLAANAARRRLVGQLV